MKKSAHSPASTSLDQSESLLYEPGIYAHQRSYEENYERGPNLPANLGESSALADISDYLVGNTPKTCAAKRTIKSPARFLGHELDNPVGVAAGPLLNAHWVQFYLAMGFAVPVYKTVRSVYRACHPAPNCIYVQMPKQTPEFEAAQLGSLPEVQSGPAPKSLSSLSITNSFGVPSMAPKVWMPDVEKALSHCGAGRLLIVSILGTEGAAGRSLQRDFAYVAAMAQETGAKVIEANFSCPNLTGNSSGMLYADAEAAQGIAREIRRAIGNKTQLLLKTGYLPAPRLKELIVATRPYVDGYAGINTIAGNVYNADGSQALPGEGRLKSGICGAAVRKLAAQFVRDLNEIRADDDFAIAGVGGIMSPEDLSQRLNDGADIAMSATAAMWDPTLAQRWLKMWQGQTQSDS